MTDYQATYAKHRDILMSLIEERDSHAELVPNCGTAPMCIGTAGLMALGSATMADPTHPIKTLIVAVAELSKSQKLIADLRRQVDQKAAAYADEAVRAMRIEAELMEAQGRLGDAEARLTMYEEADGA